VVGKDEELRKILLQWLHESVVGGHFRRDVTLKRLKVVVYWRGLTKDVKTFV